MEKDVLTATMDPLQYFDEEYTKFLNNVSDVASLLVMSKTVVTDSLAIKEQYSEILQSKELTSESLNKLLKCLEHSIEHAQQLLALTQELQASFNKAVAY